MNLADPAITAPVQGTGINMKLYFGKLYDAETL
jgi:hypothetical protein